MKKSSINIVLVGAVVVLLIVAGYFVMMKKSTYYVDTGALTSTANWKTYTNEQYGFELKIPSDWIINKFQGGVSFISPEELAEVENNQKNCDDNNDSTFCHPEPMPVNFVFTNKSARDVPGGDAKQIGSRMINGIEFNIYSVTTLTTFSMYETMKNSRIYNFEFNGEEILLNQILSTLKFTDQVKWETYRNEKYGFEFMYPTGHKLFENNPVSNSPGLEYHSVSFAVDDQQFGKMEYNDIITFSVHGGSGNPENFLRNAFGARYDDGISKSKLQKNSFAGRLAITDNSNFFSGGFLSTYIYGKDDSYFILITQGSGKEILDTIISTFKFTE